MVDRESCMSEDSELYCFVAASFQGDAIDF